MTDLNSVAVVTGGLGALGSAICKRLIAAGWRVVVLDASPHHPSGTNAGIVLSTVDLRDPASVSVAAAQVRAFGLPIGALVNVAGGFRWETVLAGSLDTWEGLYETNVKTALVTCREFLPDLTKGGSGRIVNVGAAAAAKAGAGMGAYAASKSAVLRLTEALAEEHKDAGIRVNAVLPSIIDTPANRASMPDADFTKWVTPKALADVVAFLLSPDARAITGAGIPVTGRV